jgi:MFS family permease
MLNKGILFAFLGGLCIGVTFLNIPPGLSVLMGLYRINYTGISVLISALLWSHALMQVPAGLVTDRLGVKQTLFTSMAFLVCGNFLPVIGPSLGLAILGRVVAGIGTGLSFVTIMKLIALSAPGGRVGVFQAFFAGLFSFGNILAYFFIPRLIVFGWRWVFVAPGLFSLLLLILCFGLRLESGPVSSQKPVVSLARVLRIRAGWILGLYHALSWGTMINLGNWIPSLLAEFWAHSSPAQLAWGGMLVLFISGIGRMSGGFVLLKIAPLLVANASILILAFIFSGLFAAGGPEFLLPLALLAALFSCINFGAFFHLASTVIEAGSLATLIGFVNFLANVGAVLFTLLFGFSKDATGTFSWSFGVLALLTAGALAVGHSILKRDCSRDSCRIQ